jgi:hypothetical protein
VGTSGRGEQEERVKEGKYGGLFVFMIGNRRMKPVEVVLRSGGGRGGRLIKRVNLIRLFCKHRRKCHNVLCSTIPC